MLLKKVVKKLSVIVTMVLTINTLGPSYIFATSGGATPKVYNCTEGSCCDCSSVLGSFIQEIITANRLATQYSEANFKDDLMMGIHKAIRDGSEYDFELAKYEMLNLLINYGDINAMRTGKITINVKNEIRDATGKVTGHTWGTAERTPVTPKDLIEGYTNSFLKQYESTPDNWKTSAQQAANDWNVIIKNYITFNKSYITLNDIQEILIKVGIDNASGKSLEQLKKGLKHTHDPAKATEGIFEDCDCKHICSLYGMAVIQATDVKSGSVGGYSQYVEAKISPPNSILTGLMSEKIRIPVKKVGTLNGRDYYMAAECVCRLGAEVISVTPATLTPTWTDATNYIQPEGVTNVSVDIKFDEKCRDIIYSIDLTTLINEKLFTDTLMSYTLKDALGNPASKIQIKKLGASPSIIESKYYKQSVNGNKLVIEFNKYDDVTNGPFYAEKNDEYSVNIYIPTKMGTSIKYSEYKNGYITGGNKKQNITTELVATVRIQEAGEKDFGPPIGKVTLPEVYGSTPSSPVPKEIELTYWEMPNIN